MRCCDFPTMTLRRDEIERFDEEGFVRIGRILDDGEIAALVREEDRLRARGTREALTVVTQTMHRSAIVRNIALAGRQISALRQLMGEDICLTHQQFVTKGGGARADELDVPWHQDNGYGTLEPMTDVTVWTPLVDTDLETGCLWVQPGSHRGGLLEHRTDGRTGLRALEVDAPGVAVPLEAGEAIAFSGLLVHCSRAHRGVTARTGFYLRYCEPHARMLTQGGKPVLEDGYSWMVSGCAP
jgi:phytanoyl-CoA hydroxylase